jgi:hypothetical protein
MITVLNIILLPLQLSYLSFAFFILLLIDLIIHIRILKNNYVLIFMSNQNRLN